MVPGLGLLVPEPGLGPLVQGPEPGPLAPGLRPGLLAPGPELGPPALGPELGPLAPGPRPGLLAPEPVVPQPRFWLAGLAARGWRPLLAHLGGLGGPVPGPTLSTAFHVLSGLGAVLCHAPGGSSSRKPPPTPVASGGGSGSGPQEPVAVALQQPPIPSSGRVPCGHSGRHPPPGGHSGRRPIRPLARCVVHPVRPSCRWRSDCLHPLNHQH